MCVSPETVFSLVRLVSNCWNFVPGCLISFNLILLVSSFMKRSTSSSFVSFETLSPASESFFCVSVRENFLPQCG